MTPHLNMPPDPGAGARSDSLPVAQALAMSAITNCNVSALKAALARGADPNAPFPDGLSLLRALLVGIVEFKHSSSDQRLECIQTLIEAGADVCALGPDAQGDLHFAARRLTLLGFAPLLKATRDIDARSASGLSALHCAVISNQLPIAQALLSAGADINAQDQDGDTPLHFAVARGELGMLSFLLDQGASCVMPNDAGLEPWRVCFDQTAPASPLRARMREAVAAEESRELNKSMGGSPRRSRPARSL